MSFYKIPLKFLVIFLLFFITATKVNAQVIPSGIQQVVSKIDTFHSRMPGEKVYLQMDKPYYAVGDTIWFKAYILNSMLGYSQLSGRLYVELLNDSNRVVKRIATAVGVGVTWGNIELPSGDIKEGSYTIRAYTNWMRNLGPESFFYQSFYVADPAKQAWVINANSSLSTTDNSVKMDIKLSGLDNKPIGSKDVQLKLMDGKHVIYKGTAQSTADGMLNINFPLPVNSAIKNLALVAQDKNDAKQSVTIPININRAEDIDIQFMPESGSIIAGIPSHIGFKAIGEDGKGIDITGTVIAKTSGQEVLSFQSLHKGMGTIDLLPKEGEIYTSKIKLPDGQTKDVPLPAVKSSGTVLRIRNMAQKDTMVVSIFITDDIVKQNMPLYLIGQAREVVCFAATIPAGIPTLTVHVAKSLFPIGIAHFTLLNANNIPVNERLTFINHNDNIKIDIKPLQKDYTPRDSIHINLLVNNSAGKPMIGSFSAAVTDDSQVKGDISNTGSILTHLLLTSDLKGYVEDPGYYFTDDKDAWQSLDALLLTQGWIGYDWKNINMPVKLHFDPELSNVVRGKVTSVLNSPMVNADVSLISTGKFRFVRDTVTNNQGEFAFDKLPPVDSSTFVLEAHKGKNHKAINAGISIDQVNPPDTKDLKLPAATPWYVNSNSAVLNYIRSDTVYRNELQVAQYGHLLKQVDIKGNPIINGSDNLNGAGNADQVIDEDVINKAGKTTLFDLILKNVKGYQISFLPKSQNQDFFVHDKKVRFVFDGVDLTRYYVPVSGQPDEYYYFIKQYLDYFTAEDIKGIEVLYSAKYIAAYNNQKVTDNDEFLALDATGSRGSDNVYLEITTRAGSGPFIKTANGVYVYKPMPTTLPKKFYQPRYLAKTDGKNFTDLRSTIAWEPNIITNKNGEASFTFFAADKPTTYTITLEGSDLNGSAGCEVQKITIVAGK